jgi:hypothetical protein
MSSGSTLIATHATLLGMAPGGRDGVGLYVGSPRTIVLGMGRVAGGLDTAVLVRFMGVWVAPGCTPASSTPSYYVWFAG